MARREGGVAFERLEDGDLVRTADRDRDDRRQRRRRNSSTTQAKQSSDPSEDVSYEGVDFKVGGSEDNAVGVIGDIARPRRQAKRNSRPPSTPPRATRSPTKIASRRDLRRLQRQPRRCLRRRRRDHRRSPTTKSTRRREEVLRELPASTRAKRPRWPASSRGSDQIEVDLSSDLGGEEAPSGDASELLGSLPADSFAAFAASPTSASSSKKRSTTSTRRASRTGAAAQAS